MTALPLFQSVSQALTPNALNRTESFRVEGLNAYAGDALSQTTLGGFNLPYYGDPHPVNEFIIVTGIAVTPMGPGASRITYQYGPPQQASGSQDIINLPLTDVTFSVDTSTDAASIPYIEGTALSTETAETDAQGQPTGNTIGVHKPGFEKQTGSLDHDTARIALTVTGTADQLGVDNTFGNIGAVPSIAGLARTIHLIAGVALLFRGASIRWTRSGPEGRVYTIDYEWRYEAGILNTSANLPEGWTIEPTVGSANGTQAVITDSRGDFPIDSNGDRLYGVAFPDVLAMPQLRGVGHIGQTQRYSKPPYCRAQVGARNVGEFSVPKFYTVAEYDHIDSANTWQLFPGVG